MGVLPRLQEMRRDNSLKVNRVAATQKKVKGMWVGKTIRYPISILRKQENIAKTALKTKNNNAILF